MIGKLRAMWRRRGQMAMIDAYFRSSLYLLPWLPVLSGVTPVMGRAGSSPLPVTLAGVAMGLNVAQAALAVPLLNRAVNRYLERGRHRAPCCWSRGC